MATPHTIAVAGKGGVGKTTTCGMIVDYLCKKKQGPILVVDADANSNLNEVLGVEEGVSLGTIREEMAQAELKGTIPAGMTKADYADMKFSDALIEEDDFDMIVMGRTQGKGCYCYVNGVLKTQIDKYAKNYRYLVMDNEAGLEHVARGTLPHVDTMLLISDCSRRGIQAVARIAEMILFEHCRCQGSSCIPLGSLCRDGRVLGGAGHSSSYLHLLYSSLQLHHSK